ncbi:MAG: PPC domain-containing DNA-binding protein [Thermoleophilia bacterium]
MQYTEGTIGRVFILRLEVGEVLNDTIEAFARDHDVDRALVTYLGGSADGSRVVVGPEATDPVAGTRETAAPNAADPDAAAGPDAADQDAAGRNIAGPQPVIPIVHRLSGHREVLALGTLAPNEAGEPTLHMHAAAGREGDATVGCTRAGLQVWLVGEVVIEEILGATARRVVDAATGFALLQVGE